MFICAHPAGFSVCRVDLTEEEGFLTNVPSSVLEISGPGMPGDNCEGQPNQT